MSLKIIAGEFGSRVLTTVKGRGTRPLLAQVREALFNILGDRLDGAEVWDLFAGTGASGIEALSRGATRVRFVEKSNQALATLRANLEALGPSAVERSEVLKADAWNPPPALAGEDSDVEVAPDVVFLDPPYDHVAEDPVRAAYRARALLQRVAPGGVIAFHFMAGHLDEDDFAPEFDVDLRTWGTSSIALLSMPGAEAVEPRGEDAADGGDDDDLATTEADA